MCRRVKKKDDAGHRPFLVCGLFHDMQHGWLGVRLRDAHRKAVIPVRRKCRQEQGVSAADLVAVQPRRHPADVDPEAAQRQVQPPSGGFDKAFLERPQLVERIVPCGREQGIQVPHLFLVEKREAMSRRPGSHRSISTPTGWSLMAHTAQFAEWDRLKCTPGSFTR